jgi:hypothetical protein
MNGSFCLGLRLMDNQMNLDFFLQVCAQIFTYGGLILATCSSLWGATHDLREPDAGGVKRLTRAGHFAIGLTLFGLIGALSSRAVGDQLDRVKDQKERVRAATVETNQRNTEILALKNNQLQIALALNGLKKAQEATDAANRVREEQRARFDGINQAEDLREKREVARQARSTTDLLLAAQPIRSISITWQFPRETSAIYKQPSDDSSESEFRGNDEAKFMDRDLFEAIASGYRRRELLYPFLNHLGGGANSANPVVMLLALDDAGSAVLPLGLISGAKNGLLESPVDLSAYAFDPNTEIWTPDDIRLACPLPTIRQIPMVEIRASASSACIANAIHYSDIRNFANAKLPLQITIKIVTRIKRAPFSFKNVTSLSDGIDLLWGRSLEGLSSKDKYSSLLRVEVNGLQQQSVTYEVRKITMEKLTLHGGQENEPEEFVTVTTYRGYHTKSALAARPH